MRNLDKINLLLSFKENVFVLPSPAHVDCNYDRNQILAEARIAKQWMLCALAVVTESVRRRQVAVIVRFLPKLVHVDTS